MAVSGLLVMCFRWQLAFPSRPLPFLGYLLPATLVGPDGAIQPAGYNALVIWVIALFINGLSSITGVANYVTTVVNLRCPVFEPSPGREPPG